MAQTLTHAYISKQLPAGRHFDTTRGLHLYAKGAGTKSWVYRYTVNKKTRDKGLGAYPEVSLAQAREKAAALRQMILRGENLDKQENHEPEVLRITFKDFAEDYIATNESQWKNIKHRDQWRNTLSQYAYPIIGSKNIQEIETSHVLAVIKPVWGTKTETASRVRGRIERILSAATTLGHRTGINPALWRGHLENILPKPKKVKDVKHHAAYKYADLPGFIAKLRSKDCMSALALEFLILTASRTGEVRFATWDEIDRDIWVIPASRMKAKKEHRVPLTRRCLEILQILSMVSGREGYIFQINGRPLSNVAMANLLERMAPGFTVHGFRSTFRDWVGEETEIAGEVAEMALAHQIQNKVEAVYRRGNLFQRRVSLMNQWLAYTESQIP